MLNLYDILKPLKTVNGAALTFTIQPQSIHPVNKT